MQLHSIRIAFIAGLGAVAVSTLAARAQAPVALTGRVSAAAEAAMEGVLVSARKQGSTVTVTVASDSSGRFSFPATKLEPGSYTLAIRAVGYELNGQKSIEVAGDKVAAVDLSLRPTRNLAKQLTNAEWLASLPGTDAQKK